MPGFTLEIASTHDTPCCSSNRRCAPMSSSSSPLQSLSRRTMVSACYLMLEDYSLEDMKLTSALSSSEIDIYLVKQ